MKKVVALYSGRFQPFTVNHLNVYNLLKEKFDDVLITTSDKTEQPSSPFNFKEKQKIISTLYGIPEDKIIQIRNPYGPIEVLKSHPLKDNTFVTVIGEKDEQDRFKDKPYILKIKSKEDIKDLDSSEIASFPMSDETNEKKVGKDNLKKALLFIVPNQHSKYKGKFINGTLLRDYFSNDKLSSVELKDFIKVAMNQTDAEIKKNKEELNFIISKMGGTLLEKKMSFREHYLSEAPLIYDDEDSSQQKGTLHKDTGTIWSEVPPVDATVDEIATFVSKAMNTGIIPKQKPLGTGSCRTVIGNDGKTIFKYTYNDSARFAEQTAQENATYDKYGKKYSDILPKMYKHGKHWSVQELVEPFTEAKFKKATGISYKDWNDFVFDITKQKVSGPTDNATTKKASDGIGNRLKNSDGIKALLAVLSKRSEMSNIKKAVSKSKVLQRILEFCLESNTKIIEAFDDNLGFRQNGDMVLLDYGLSTTAVPNKINT